MSDLITKIASDSTNGIYTTKYGFAPIGPDHHCGEGSICEGYSLRGELQMITTPTGVNTLELMATVKGAQEFKKTSIFGVGWALEYGKEKKQTEAYFAMWSWQQNLMRNGWANMNVKTNLSLDKVKEDPRAAQTTMIPEKVQTWVPTVTKHLGKDLQVGATRNLN